MLAIKVDILADFYPQRRFASIYTASCQEKASGTALPMWGKQRQFNARATSLLSCEAAGAVSPIMLK